MNRKLLLSLLLFLFFVPAVFGGGISLLGLSPLNGLVMGFGAGAISGDARIQNVFRVTSDPTNIILQTNSREYNMNGIGALSLEYRVMLGEYFLVGIASTADVENIHFNKNVGLQEPNIPLSLLNSVSVKLKNTIAILLKSGFMLSPKTALYVIVGPRWGHFHSVSRASFYADGDLFPNSATSSGGQSRAKYTAGITAGIGMEQYVGYGLSCSLEYDYSHYSHVNLSTTISPILSQGTHTGTIAHELNNAAVNMNAVLFSLVYRFMQ